MINATDLRFIGIDCEYRSIPGELPIVHCICVKDFQTNESRNIWIENQQRENLENLLWLNDPKAVFVSYYGLAELSCLRSLRLCMPKQLCDVWAEFKNLMNGRALTSNYSLVSATNTLGLESIDESNKDSMRELAIRGSPFSDDEAQKLLDYCMSDVEALHRLFDRIKSYISIEHALLRGRYLIALSSIEENGIPLDSEKLDFLVLHDQEFKKFLIKEVDTSFNVYEGTIFKTDKFKKYLTDQKIPWPMTDKGRIKLDEDTFKTVASIYPEIEPLRQLRTTLAQVRLGELPTGKDFRNRFNPSPFGSVTGRNQPRSKRFIFGLPSWTRNLITPPAGKSLIYLDYSQQEFGIGAALSKDNKMIEAYNSGDPYLAFAKQVGAVPVWATKETHPIERNLYKACVLAVQYGMGPTSLAFRIGKPEAYAKELLEDHKRNFSLYWDYIDQTVNRFEATGQIRTMFDWRLHRNPLTKIRTVQNFQMQATGAEILRIGVIALYEKQIKLCATIHDAVLIECDSKNTISISEEAKQVLEDASEVVLNGFRIRVDAKTFVHPSNFAPEKGLEMWHKVQSFIDLTRNSLQILPVTDCNRNP